MTQEQIEQAAKEYAETEWYTKRTLDVPGMGGHIGMMERAFIAGAESRQAEVTELVGALNALSEVFIEMSKGAYPTLANEPIVISAQELLKKQSK